MMMTDARKARAIFAHIDPRQKISSIKIEDPVGARPLPGHLPPPRGRPSLPCRTVPFNPDLDPGTL